MCNCDPGISLGPAIKAFKLTTVGRQQCAPVIMTITEPPGVPVLVFSFCETHFKLNEDDGQAKYSQI